MNLKHLIIALSLATGCAASSGYGAVQLSSLTDPTLQTLITMGSAPVVVGPYQFSDFDFTDASTGASSTAAQIQVQPLTTNGYGLQFVANWFAANGTMVDDVVSYDVQTTNPPQPVTQISLLSNGTAPVPVTGTFTTATLIASLPGGGTAAPILSTYNDGLDTSIDVNYAVENLPQQPQLHVMDTLLAISTPAGAETTGGVATTSVLQNAFTPASIPEPSQPGWIFLPMAVVVTASGRRWRKPAR